MSKYAKAIAAQETKLARQQAAADATAQLIQNLKDMEAYENSKSKK